MLRSSVLLILLFISGCHHEKNEPYYLEPQAVLEPEPTPVILEAPKHSHEEVEIQADAPMETKAVEARPQMRDAQIQTEEERRMLDIDNLEDVESILLDEEQPEEQQEIAPRPRSLSEYTIHQSEYLDEDELESPNISIIPDNQQLNDSQWTLKSEELQWNQH